MLAYWDRDTWLPFCRWHIQTYSPKWELSNFIQIPLQFFVMFWSATRRISSENGLAAIEVATSHTLLWVTWPRGFKYTCMNISWYDTSNFSPFDFSQYSYLKNKFEFTIKKIIEICSLGSDWPQVSVGGGNGLVPYMWQTLAWTNDDQASDIRFLWLLRNNYLPRVRWKNIL